MKQSSGYIFNKFYIFLKKIFLFSIPSIILTLFLLELLVRFFLKASDSPDVYFDSFLGNRYLSRQVGNYIKGKKSEINAKYRINNDGWNSPIDYKPQKENNFRIAIIGDSFVEALQVDYDKSFPYLLQKFLNNSNKKIEVYSFGHSGANFLQYFYMADYVKRYYHPDFIVVNIVLNDFDESLYGLNRKDNWSLKPYYENFIEIVPQQVSNLSIKRVLSKSALVRFLTLNLDLINTSPILNSLFYAETRNFNDTRQIKEQYLKDQFLQTFTDFLFGKFIKKFDSSKLLFIMDADRQSLYKGVDPKLKQNYRLNHSLKIASKKFNANFIDLSDKFKNDWDSNHQKFNWDIDDHWNEYGHQIVARTIFQWINDNIDLSSTQH